MCGACVDSVRRSLGCDPLNGSGVEGRGIAAKGGSKHRAAKVQPPPRTDVMPVCLRHAGR